MIMTLSLDSLRRPHVLYATGTSLKGQPFSSVKVGTTWMDCSRAGGTVDMLKRWMQLERPGQSASMTHNDHGNSPVSALSYRSAFLKVNTTSLPPFVSPSIPVCVSFFYCSLIIHIAVAPVHATMDDAWRLTTRQFPLFPANEGQRTFALGRLSIQSCCCWIYLLWWEGRWTLLSVVRRTVVSGT